MLSHEIVRLLDELYGDLLFFAENLGFQMIDDIYPEVQELRHSTVTMSRQEVSSSTESRINSMLVHLDSSIDSLAPRVSSLCAETTALDGAVKDGVDQLKIDWQRVSEQQSMLREEMKEDGWLIRFRT